MKKFLTLIILSVLLSTLFVLPTFAQVDVNVVTTDDVNVYIDADGNVAIYYNGKNIFDSVMSLYSQLSSAVSSLSTAVGSNSQRITQLQVELEEILNELFKQTNLLANVIGIVGEDNDVAENLATGGNTVAGYIEDLQNDLQDLSSDINTLRITINNINSETTSNTETLERTINDLTLFAEDIMGNFNVLAEEIERITGNQELMVEKINENIVSIDELKYKVQTLENDNSTLWSRVNMLIVVIAIVTIIFVSLVIVLASKLGKKANIEPIVETTT